MKISDFVLAGAWADYFGKAPTKRNLIRYRTALAADLTEWLKDNAKHVAETMTEKQREKAFDYDD